MLKSQHQLYLATAPAPRPCCARPSSQSELESFLVEITASIFKKKDEVAEGWLIDKVLDKTGMKVRTKQCCDRSRACRDFGSNGGLAPL